MADAPDDGPSLEMPSLSLRRRRKKERAEDAPVAEPEPVTDEQPSEEPTAVVPAVETESTTAFSPLPGAEPAAEPEAAHEAATEPRQLALPGVAAAVVTGVVVGALAVALAWVAGQGCDTVRGTTSCGGAIGLPVLVLGLALLAWVGSLLLRTLGVADAGSTSILAVGVLAVLVLVFLLGSLDEWWTVLAIPALGVVGYAVSWWVTTAVVGDDETAEVEAPEPYDVR